MFGRQEFTATVAQVENAAGLSSHKANATGRSTNRSMDAILIYDGDCGFCSSAITFMSRVLPVQPPVMPYQWADLPSPRLTEAEASARLWLITPEHRYGGHLAVSEMMRHQPHVVMRFLGWVIATPPYSLLAALAYRIIARYRHRLPGGTPACAVGPGRSTSDDDSVTDQRMTA